MNYDDKVWSLKELDDIATQFNSDKGCPTCSGLLGGLETYPHDGGIFIEGIEGKQWAYFTCLKCGYQWALWKLLRRLGK